MSSGCLRRRLWDVLENNRLREREREKEGERDLKSAAADRSSITISYINTTK